MFIGWSVTPDQLRSKERNGSGMVKLYLGSAPSTGVRGVLANRSINMLPERQGKLGVSDWVKVPVEKV
jgi:hypothetical protein